MFCVVENASGLHLVDLKVRENLLNPLSWKSNFENKVRGSWFFIEAKVRIRKAKKQWLKPVTIKMESEIPGGIKE